MAVDSLQRTLVCWKRAAVGPARARVGGVLLVFPAALLAALVWAQEEKPRSPVVPAGPDVAEPAEMAVRPCSFQQVTPGETSLADVLTRLGKPVEETELGGEKILRYEADPFSRVEILVAGDIVTSIVLHLKEPGAARQIADELQLGDIEPAHVFSETGQILGCVYPERGLLLNFAAPSASSKVSQLILEQITAEPFLLRAKHDTRHRYQRNLADLEQALKLEPSNADALARKALVLAKTGRVAEALEATDQALQLLPGEAAFRLQRARLLAQLERHDEAETIVRDIAGDSSAAESLKAEAECIWGDLLARGPARDCAAAVQHHLDAIKLATPGATGADREQRRRSKEVLIDSFLAAAHDIAAGNWQRRPETTAKWLASARELADAMMAKEEGDSTLALRVHCATLEAQADLASDVDPSQMLASIDREARRLCESADDPMFQQTVDFCRARALFDAASIEQGRGGATKALEYAGRAADLLEPLLEQRELTPSERLFAGKLLFFVGSGQAVIHRKHDEAVRWYERARTYLADTLPPSARRELGRHGERLVSMGASYWELEHHDDALALTRRGMEMMQQAVKQGLLSEQSLSLPYGNLAAMYQLKGRPDDARSFAELAARTGAATRTPRARR